MIDLTDPRYFKRMLSGDEMQILQRLLSGQRIISSTGDLLPDYRWDRRQKYGALNNEYGLCEVVVGKYPKISKRIKADIGIEIDERVEKHHWEPAQVAWSIHNTYIPCSVSFGRNNNRQHTASALTISHKCGRHSCINIEHLELVTNKENLRRCTCHRQIKRIDKTRRFKLENTAFRAYGKCECENGRCFVNLNKFPRKNGNT